MYGSGGSFVAGTEGDAGGFVVGDQNNESMTREETRSSGVAPDSGGCIRMQSEGRREEKVCSICASAAHQRRFPKAPRLPQTTIERRAIGLSTASTSSARASITPRSPAWPKAYFVPLMRMRSRGVPSLCNTVCNVPSIPGCRLYRIIMPTWGVC
ncbi:hypothetical protein L226DRAFT_11549 [Lentinus tigrinus ALCF2SS1-7]|uniref:uncharacterized protein n=1 Tax=Lentinus tigrinus ALCF2SS1-7 TaxID=1328758 RepID=UPI00116616F0|nr:hypothetical protein L226DRAFT_11549 [Lentinus tigrinus ALCF2SS1-7]